MKKNLRIVSAAAAALLAVAPVAAGVVPAATKTLNVPAALVSGAASFGTLPAKESQVKTIQNYNNGETTAQDNARGQLGRILAYNGLASNYVVNYVENVQTVGSKTTVTFQLATSNKDAKKTLKKLGYKFETGHDEDSSYKVVLNGNDKAKFTVVLDTKAANTPADTSSEHILTDGNKIANLIFDTDSNTSVNINAVAKYAKNGAKVGFASSINGNITYTDDKGASHTALLHGTDNTVVGLYNSLSGKWEKLPNGSNLIAGTEYVAKFNKVTVNLGNAAAGSKVKFVLPKKTAWFEKADADNNYANVKTVPVDSNGIADLGAIYARFYAYNPSDLQEVHFFSEKTGNQVTSGSVNLHAVNGKLNLFSFFHAMTQEYKAAQLDGGQRATYASRDMLPVAVQNDLRDQLKKQNIDVDPNGYFTAPASFTVNMNAKSIYNGATASLPVTVTVDNVTPAASQETTKTVTIMHIAAIYDKNGVATHDPALRAYDTYSVVSEPVTINGAKFYKLAGKDQYIKVGNVDGTSRTLKHNSYVYKSTGKRANKKTLKKGSSVTTYGKSFMIAGHQMYRIGKNQYVKKANF